MSILFLQVYLHTTKFCIILTQHFLKWHVCVFTMTEIRCCGLFLADGVMVSASEDEGPSMNHHPVEEQQYGNLPSVWNFYMWPCCSFKHIMLLFKFLNFNWRIYFLFFPMWKSPNFSSMRPVVKNKVWRFVNNNQSFSYITRISRNNCRRFSLQLQPVY